MIRLDEFGYCLEDYIYTLENCEVKEISYTLHNEKNQDVAVVGVYNNDGNYKRSLVIWPHNDPNYEDKGYIDEDVEEMRLYLDTVDSKFDFKNITIYRYESAKQKTIDEFEVTITTDNGKDISICVDRNNVAVYDTSLKVFKIFTIDKDGKIDYNNQQERIRITDFGIISETNENLIYIIKGSSVSTYEFETFDTPIEALEKQCTSFSNIDDKEYKIKYDNDGFVETISCDGLLYSRNEGEEQIFKSQGKIGEIKDSIYPTLITDNYLNYKYPFMQLWTHDKLKKDKNGEVIYFQRRIFYIKKYDKLLELLRSDLTHLKINY